jgi:hypothetical protein
LQAIVAKRDDIWITTAGGIADYCRTLPEGVIPS